jgi:hypothetical protein
LEVGNLFMQAMIASDNLALNFVGRVRGTAVSHQTARRKAVRRVRLPMAGKGRSTEITIGPPLRLKLMCRDVRILYHCSGNEDQHLGQTPRGEHPASTIVWSPIVPTSWPIDSSTTAIRIGDVGESPR